MYEDPFDPLSSSLFAIVVCLGGLLDLILRRIWLLIRYHMGVSWLYTKHSFTLVRLTGWNLCLQLYYRHIRLWLELLGLVRPLTWADVEAYRLHLNVKWGQEFPRPEGLEEALD